MLDEFKTTFWSDFSIADRFGIAAIKDTYKRAFSEWKDNLEYVTELSIVLNWKIWQHYKKKDDAKAQTYNDLWLELDHYLHETLTGEELQYYLRETD